MSSESDLGEGVLLLESPWTGGRTIETYYGPVEVHVRVPRDPREGYSERVTEGISQAIEQMQDIAAGRGANAIACPALEIDPFGENIEIRGVGSAFELRVKQKMRPWSLLF